MRRALLLAALRAALVARGAGDVDGRPTRCSDRAASGLCERDRTVLNSCRSECCDRWALSQTSPATAGACRCSRGVCGVAGDGVPWGRCGNPADCQLRGVRTPGENFSFCVERAGFEWRAHDAPAGAVTSRRLQGAISLCAARSGF